jgi:Protein of unknown function (DUF1822)
MKSPEFLTVSVPISVDAYRLAQRFSRYHSHPHKAKQVYLNILAVSVVKLYLRCMGIETNSSGCLSNNPLIQTLLDVADLEVKGFGKIECRPVELENKDNTIRVPLEVCLDRIGYIFVQIDESLKRATLLGFSKTIPENGELSINELQSLEDLLLVLSQPTELETQSIVSRAQITYLSQWFQNIFEIGWETVESVLSIQQQAEIAFRCKYKEQSNTNNFDNKFGSITSSLERAKLLDLGEQVALLVELIPISQEEIDIWVKVCAFGTRKNLPEELQLFVLDDGGIVVMQATARSTENILLNFSSFLGEHFSVKLALNNVNFTEYFQV